MTAKLDGLTDWLTARSDAADGQKRRMTEWENDTEKI